MNKKGSSIKSYIFLIVVLILALFFIFYLLNSEKEDRKPKPMTNKVEATTKESKSEENGTTTTTVVVDNNEDSTIPINIESVSNFKASLDDITYGLVFINNYSITTYFHGVEFTFKCTNFDEGQKKCLDGSALMKVDNALYPLYTYSNDTENYLLRGYDYYIILNDDMVILYTSNSGVSAGDARIFDRNGNSIGKLTNTLSSYVYEGVLYKKIYPNIEENTIYYYSCENNQVVIKSAELGSNANEQILETVEGSCY
ncbi:MAG: hypothetical protein J1F35_04335 [Erysipelotrichales bacterium]|nr:hypothetical protein [Erysipelotrichales bacterium]